MMKFSFTAYLMVFTKIFDSFSFRLEKLLRIKKYDILKLFYYPNKIFDL